MSDREVGKALLSAAGVKRRAEDDTEDDAVAEAKVDELPVRIPPARSGDPDIDDLWERYAGGQGYVVDENIPPASRAKKPINVSRPRLHRNSNVGGGGGGGGGVPSRPRYRDEADILDELRRSLREGRSKADIPPYPSSLRPISPGVVDLTGDEVDHLADIRGILDDRRARQFSRELALLDDDTLIQHTTRAEDAHRVEQDFNSQVIAAVQASEDDDFNRRVIAAVQASEEEDFIRQLIDITP